MQFVVPQFIEVESKIIGPISARQFIILLITFAIGFILFRLFSALVFIPGIIIFGGSGFLLAFAKINGQSMHYVMLNFLYTLKRPRLQVWDRLPYNERPELHTVEVDTSVADKREVTQSRLASMSLMVDTGGVYTAEESPTAAPTAAPSVVPGAGASQQVGQQLSQQEPPISLPPQ